MRMRNRSIILSLIAVLIVLPFTGCLDNGNGDDEDTVPDSIPAPTWQPGKFWIYAFTTPDDEDIASRLVVAPDDGTNHLVGNDPEKAENVAVSILSGNIKKGKIPEKWDGKTAERIVDIINSKLT